MDAQIEGGRQQGCPGRSFADQSNRQKQNDPTEWAEDRNEIQTKRHYTPKHWSGHVTQPHHARRRAPDGSVDHRNRQQILRQITLDTKRDRYGLPLVRESRQNLDKPEQEGLSEHEQVEQDEE